MPEYCYLVDFECPECECFDENVMVPKEEYDEAIEKKGGWLDHTCEKCGCEFKVQK